MYSVVLLLAASTGGEAAACPPVFFPCPPVYYSCPPVIYTYPRVVVPVCPPVVVRPVVVRPVPAVTRVDLGIVKDVLDLFTDEDEDTPIQKTQVRVGIEAKAKLKLSTETKVRIQEEDEDEAPPVKIKGRVAAPCTIVARVPVKARLYIDGQLCRSSAARRTFITPPLEPGRSCNCKVRVEFDRDGETVSIKRTIKISAGVTTEFTIGDEDEDE